MSEETQDALPEKTESPSEQPAEPPAEQPAKKRFKKPTKKQVLHEVVTWLLMTLGTVLVAGGVYFFKAPNHFATGGVSGLSIVLAKYLPLKQSHLVKIGRAHV